MAAANPVGAGRQCRLELLVDVVALPVGWLPPDVALWWVHLIPKGCRRSKRRIAKQFSAGKAIATLQHRQKWRSFVHTNWTQRIRTTLNRKIWIVYCGTGACRSSGCLYHHGPHKLISQCAQVASDTDQSFNCRIAYGRRRRDCSGN